MFIHMFDEKMRKEVAGPEEYIGKGVGTDKIMGKGVGSDEKMG